METTLNPHKNFSFNYLKHHLFYSIEYLDQNSESNSREKNVKNIIEELKTVGNNITDIYTGLLSIYNIIDCIYCNLKENKIFEYSDFIKLFYKQEYFKIEIIDGSVWIVRKGKSLPEYIHIHPARIGNLTVRFPANTWKTALLCYYHTVNDTEFEFELNTINYLRTNYLELPPVKRINQKGNISEAYDLLLKSAANKISFNL